MKSTLEFKLCIRNNNPPNLGMPGILHMPLVIFIKPLKDKYCDAHFKGENFFQKLFGPKHTAAVQGAGALNTALPLGPFVVYGATSRQE